MHICFADKKLEKAYSRRRLLLKTYGRRQSSKLRQRFDDLEAVSTLAAMRDLPGRCHELSGNRAGQLALDLNHPYRLIFEPNHDPIPTKVDGGLDWTTVTSICIIGVEDYHG